MDLNDAYCAIEAILFVAGESVAIAELPQALGLSDVETECAIAQLQQDYARQPRGMVVRRYGDRLKLETNPEYALFVERLLQPIQRQSLSQVAMETLAVVAYRQPVTKGEIEQIRGVKCDYSVQSLVHKGLIQEVGRKEALGRPILYGTTDLFLEHFAISDVRELPPLPNAISGKDDASDELLTP